MSEEQKKIELKPCPFCGGEAYFTDREHTIAGVDMIMCSKCGCRMYNGNAEKWNTRADEITAEQKAKVLRLCARVIEENQDKCTFCVEHADDTEPCDESCIPYLAKQLKEELQG